MSRSPTSPWKPPLGPGPHLRWLVAGVALVLILASAHTARAERGDELEVAVLTFGPGDGAFDKFGHNAIWIRDESGPGATDYVYNYGTYAFESSDIFLKFPQGRMEYWLSRKKGIDSTVRNYRRQNRSIVAQVLALTPAQKANLFDRLEDNVKPENKYYKYDYYRDNCSTRVRDAIDAVTDNAVQAANRGEGAFTLRQHTLRLTADFTSLYVALHLVMGGRIDQPIDRNAEMFLPMKLQEGLSRTKVAAPDGSEVPLVREERVLFEASRPPPRDRPPAWAPWFLLVGVVLGGGMAALGRTAARRAGTAAGSGARVALGAVLSFFGLALGFLGWFYLLVWAFTDHQVGYKNENTFHCAPWALALIVLGVGVALGRAGAIRKALIVTGAAAAFSCLGLVLKVLPWFYQDNWQIIATLLPFWLGSTFGLRELEASTRLARPTAEPDATAAKPARKAGKGKKRRDVPAKDEGREPAPGDTAPQGE